MTISQIWNLNNLYNNKNGFASWVVTYPFLFYGFNKIIIFVVSIICAYWVYILLPR